MIDVVATIICGLLFMLAGCSRSELDGIPVADMDDNVDASVFFEEKSVPMIDTGAEINSDFSETQKKRFEALKKFAEKREKMTLDMASVCVDKSRRYEIYNLLYERKNASQIYYSFYFDTKLKKFVFCETSDAF